MLNTREIMELQNLAGMEKFSKRTIAEELERSKLIELLKETSIKAGSFGQQADYLIADGVTVQKWIPVTERLPKKNEMVLVYCKDKTIRGLDVRHIGSCDNGFWFLKTQPGTESFPHPEWEVTHWRPLPEPPKL